MKKEIKICFSPLLFDTVNFKNDFIAVVCDIFRATTSFCRAFYNGADAIIPVSDFEIAKKLKNEQGVLIAGEIDGQKPLFSDFGNDPAEFIAEKVKGKDIYYTTTNGTKMLLQASKSAQETIIGSFLNIEVVANYVIKQNQNVVICCSGWKGGFSFEDSFFAGALAERILISQNFITKDDDVFVSLEIWNAGKDDPKRYVAERSSHFERLKGLGKENILKEAFLMNSCPTLPVMKNGKLIDLHRKSTP
ncbi:MAG: 2-phosphosulfolactate phosphatase [Bacteroidales bacterium]|jgi:2-phosphosulfolactate phosphatase|nr:2-phosphosulfolactate phosphatase [Bacteroidales bacterium]